MKVIRMMKTTAPTILAAVLWVLLAVPGPAVGQAAGNATSAQAAPGPGGRGQDRPTRLILRDALGLTPDQEARLQELRKAQIERVQAFREKMGKMRTEHMKSALRHKLDVEKIFTPQQLEKMKTYKGSLMNRRGASGGRHMGRPFGRRGDRMGRPFMRGSRGL